MFNFIHSKRRSRLTSVRARKLVFIYQNSRLLTNSFSYLEDIPEWTPKDLLPEEGSSDGDSEEDDVLGTRNLISISSHLVDALHSVRARSAEAATAAGPNRKRSTTQSGNRFKERRVTAIDEQDRVDEEEEYVFETAADDWESDEYEDEGSDGNDSEDDEEGEDGKDEEDEEGGEIDKDGEEGEEYKKRMREHKAGAGQSTGKGRVGLRNKRR